MPLVAIDPKLRSLEHPMRECLQSAECITTQPERAHEIGAAVIPADLEQLRTLRAVHPFAFIVVYARGEHDAVVYLEAGADDCVASCSAAVLAARIATGLRRLRRI